MSRYEKLLQEIENSPINVRFEILEKILLKNGFVLQSINGSHHIYKNGEFQITLPKHKPMKVFYVKKVLKILKEIK